jgi:ribosome-binding factor A
MKESKRILRVGAQVQRELAGLIRDQVKDPRVGFVTISDVELARDFSLAKVYVTVLGTQAGREETLRGLNQAAGFLRRRLGTRIRLRTLPELRFLYDESVERGARVSALIDRVVGEEGQDDSE